MAESSPSDAQPTKLCVIVVASDDGDRLMGHLVELSVLATKIGSTGGFLRRGNVTFLSAVPAPDVSKIVAMLHREFPVRTEIVPANQLPYWEERELVPDTIEVRVGGAVMFMLNIDRFERS